MYKSVLLLIGLTLSGCAALPNTGPKITAVEQYPGAQVVPVDAQMARQMQQDLVLHQTSDLNHAIALLKEPVGHGDHRLMAGDKIDVSVVSWSTLTDVQGSHSQTDHWSMALDASGRVNLPYLKGLVHLGGYTLPQADRMISDLYTEQRIFLAPSVQVALDTAGSTHGILVTGNIGSPKIVPWVSGGMTLPEVLTVAMGNGSALTPQLNDLNGGKSATIVTVIRHGVGSVSLPLDEALARDIPVAETDKIIVTRKSVVQVTVTGGGISNGLLGFDQHPSLAQAIAQAKGLNPQTADAKAVFVFRNADAPTLYSFAFKTTDAQFAAQKFPLNDGDVVYVAEAPIVPLQQIISSMWTLSNLAAIAK